MAPICYWVAIETSEADDVSKRKALLNRIDEAGGRQNDETAFDQVRLRGALRRIADSHVVGWWRAPSSIRACLSTAAVYLFANESTSFRATIREGLIGNCW